MAARAPRPLPNPPSPSAPASPSFPSGSNSPAPPTAASSPTTMSAAAATSSALITASQAVAASGGGEGAAGVPAVCNGCKLGLEETGDSVVVSFGTSLWHVDCRCAKCHNLVEHDTNLLLLSDGSPVCENCSYICSVCQKPISNEAIVTGDESYHADCFRCRSCSNKIEELIFAKTSQGIWCMACHNERVARSRKHAEAKRNRSARKEKEASAKSPRGPSSRSALSVSSAPPVNASPLPTTAAGETADMGESTSALPPPLTADFNNGANRPLPPSPHLSSSSPIMPSPADFSRSNLNHHHPASSSATTSTRPRTSPATSRTRQPSADPLAGSFSSQSLSSLAASASPVSPTGGAPPGMSISAPSPSFLDSDRRPSSSSSASVDPASSSFDPSSLPPHMSASSSQQHHQNGNTSPTLSFPAPLPSEESESADTFSISTALPVPTMRQGSLSAATNGLGAGDKSMNRRSGFYGSFSRATAAAAAAGATGVVAGNQAETKAGSAASSPSTSPKVERDDPLTFEQQSSIKDDGAERHDRDEALERPPPHPPAAPLSTSSSSGTMKKSSSSELHNSMSFYDPDTLLFLDHVGSDSDSPHPSSSSSQTSKARRPSNGDGLLTSSLTSGSIADVPAEQVEHLSPDIPGQHDEDELEEDDEGRGTEEGGQRRERKGRKSDSTSSAVAAAGEREGVVGRVRESIRLSREGVSSGGRGLLDVDLVEGLLGELEGTKKEMRELQGKYNAFRRASRTAFEGFSMAREEYDKEVAARREVEGQMDELRTRFTEQALKLAALDKEQRAAEALKRRSKELRVSVVGMEKQLSLLKAEMELSTAQMEEIALKSTGTGSTEEGRRSLDAASPSASSPLRTDLEASLNTRLESIKALHRRDIEKLIFERDELVREISELRQTREIFAEETTALNVQNTTLAEKNAEAKRQLDETREVVSKMRNPPALGAVQESSRHHHSGSTASLLSTHLLHQSSSSSSTSPAASSSAIPVRPGLVSRSAITPTPPPPDPDSTFDYTHRIVKAEEATHAPAAAAKKFKWGKTSKTHDAPSSRSNHTPAMPSTSNAKAYLPPSSTSSSSQQRSDITASSTRQHTFQPTSILRPVRCEYCGDKMWGLNEVRCTACGCYSHTKCSGNLQTCGIPSAHGQDDTNSIMQSPAMFGNDLTAQARYEDRQVPLVVSKCIGAVEAYGMNYEGIYRKTGGMGQTKLITQCFERGQEFNLEDLDKFNDLAAVTSCMKNFFRSLPDPLFTHHLHERFVACAELPEGDGRLVALENALHQLPEVHFHTAKMLIGHLHRVHLQSAENKMTPANLGVVFGPTVLRSRLASREFSDMGFKAKLVELLVEHTPRLFAKPYTPPTASTDNGAS